MKFDTNNKGISRKRISVIAIFLISIIVFVVGCSGNSKAKNDTKKSVETVTEQKEKTPEIVEKKKLTADELQYAVKAKPYIQAVIDDNAKLMKLINEGLIETSKDESIKLAQQIIENSKILEELKADESLKTISNLAQLTGYNMKDANEYFLDFIENKSEDSFEFYIMAFRDAIAYLNEYNFYALNAVTINEQLENDIMNAVGKRTFESARLAMSGNANLIINLNQDELSDKKALRNTMLMSIYDVLETLSKNKAYDYLNIMLEVNTTVTDKSGEERKLGLLNLTMKSETRNKINFDDFEWISIPDVVDEYSYLYQNKL